MNCAVKCCKMLYVLLPSNSAALNQQNARASVIFCITYSISEQYHAAYTLYNTGIKKSHGWFTLLIHIASAHAQCSARALSMQSTFIAGIIHAPCLKPFRNGVPQGSSLWPYRLVNPWGWITSVLLVSEPRAWIQLYSCISATAPCTDCDEKPNLWPFRYSPV